MTPESNLAHYQKEPDSYSWKKQVDHLGPKRAQLIQKNKKNKWITWAPHGPKGFKSQSQLDHLGPQWPKGFKSKTKWITWAPSGPRDSRAKDPSFCGSNIREPDYLRH